MDIYYLSEKLYIKNDRMYNKNKLIISKNWHKLLKEIGWYKLPTPWIKRLNKMSTVKVKNSPYGVIECGSDGDCFFHCIANALNERDINKENYYISNDIRKMISDNITSDQYDFIINTYRIMKDADDFSEDWDPYEINSLEGKTCSNALYTF